MTYFNEFGQGRVGWKSGAVAPFISYLLDTYSGAAAAYSLRRLSSTYTGNAITVRRSSDNTSTNIGFDANGDLDTNALLDFVGYKNNFNNSNVISTANAYTANGVTLTTNWLTGPDGVTPSNKMNETTTNSQHFVSYSIISGTIDSHNVSAYLKKGTGSAAPDRICIAVGNSTYGMYAIFNLSTGIIETQVAGTATSFEVKMTAEGNGFYRCSVGGKLNYSTNQVIRTAIQFCNNSSSYNPFTTSYIGNVNADVQMSYLQWLQGETVLQRYGTSATGGNGFVSTWFDQSGNGRNLTQATAIDQPRIVNAGVLETLNGKPSLYNYGTSTTSGKKMTVSFGVTLSQPNTIFNLGSSNFLTGGGSIIDGIVNGSRNSLGASDATKLYIFAGSVVQLNYAANSNTQRLLYGKFSTTSSAIAVNNGTAATGNIGTQPLTGIIINASYTGSNSSTLNHQQEIIIWNADKSSDRTGISNNINSFYSTY